MIPTFEFVDGPECYPCLNVEDILGNAGVLEDQRSSFGVPEFLKQSSEGIFENCSRREPDNFFNLGDSISF